MHCEVDSSRNTGLRQDILKISQNPLWSVLNQRLSSTNLYESSKRTSWVHGVLCPFFQGLQLFSWSHWRPIHWIHWICSKVRASSSMAASNVASWTTWSLHRSLWEKIQAYYQHIHTYFAVLVDCLWNMSKQYVQTTMSSFIPKKTQEWSLLPWQRKRLGIDIGWTCWTERATQLA